jgi:deoxyguanosine kinase
LNQCIKVKTDLKATELIDVLLLIEKELGRERTINQIYEPRTIDIDILFYNNDIINESKLLVPHPRLHLRKFVLIPLEEIASNYLHPLLNKTIFNLLSECEDTSDVKLFKTQ